MLRSLLNFCAIALLIVTPAHGYETRIPYKSKFAGGWFIHASSDYCTMMKTIEERPPSHKVEFQLTYFPSRESSMVTVSSESWQALLKNNYKDIPAEFRFDDITFNAVKSGRIFAPRPVPPRISFFFDKETTPSLLDTLHRSKTMAITADGRPLGPYVMAAVPEAIGELMNCIKAAKQVLADDPFR